LSSSLYPALQAVDHILHRAVAGVHVFNLGTGTGATVLEVCISRHPRAECIMPCPEAECIMPRPEAECIMLFPEAECISLQPRPECPVLPSQVIAAFSVASGKEIPYMVAPRRKGDVDSLYASCKVQHDFTHILYPALPCTALHCPALHRVQVAEAELGWAARRSLQQMCADMWNWQTRNPQGFAGSS
jgi:hypothetical protein